MSTHSLFVQYQNWLFMACEAGEAVPCADTKLMNTVTDHLLEDPGLHEDLQNDAFFLLASGLVNRGDLHTALQHLSSAFQAFELAALHLYFAPWRKEFWTIKTYSGFYVHVLAAALPQEGIFQALRRLGYEPQEDGSILSITSMPSLQNLAAAAFGFFVAQLECGILSSILCSVGSGILSGADLIWKRRSCSGEDAFAERLKTLALDVPPVTQSASDGNACRKIEQVSHKEPPLYQPQFCDNCHEPWDQHKRGRCRQVVSIPLSFCYNSNLHEADYVLHDCVYSDKSLERRCTDCHTLHSSWCSVIAACKDSQHHVSALHPAEKHEALMEEMKNRYTVHTCVQPGQLPHYRCPTCKQLHYINCELVVQCRKQGHNATMIMLEKDQVLWLQRSTMDLTLLGLNVTTQDTQWSLK